MTPTEIVEFYNIIGLFHEGKYTSEMIEEIKRNGFSTNTSIENVETLADSKISITSRRAKKWLSMLKTWSTLDTFLKLKYRIFKDIPISMRSFVWQKSIGSDEVMTRNTRIYENILKKAKEETNETIIKQIHSDVPRVLTQHPFFGLASKYHISLFNIVLAYAHLDSRVAYCQGMCTVAAILLLHLKEETAFWSFASLMLKKRYQLQGYYYEGFPKISSLAIVVLKNVKILDVKLHNHLIILNEGILEMLLVRFTFTLFEGTLPNNILLKVWDIYLFYGEIAIVYVCTLLFTFHKEKLMQLSFDGFIQFFNNMKNEKIDVQSFFYQLKSMFADKKNLVKELDCKFKPNKLHTLCNNFKIKNGICGYNEKYSSSKIINAKNKDISKSYSNTESDLFSDSISDPYISVSSSLSDSSDYEIVYNKKSDV